jgi:hypothetical protein
MLLNITLPKFKKARFSYFHAFGLILLFTFYIAVSGYSETRLDTGDTPGANYSRFPQTISDNSGHVHVVWRDGRNGRDDIYFNYSSDCGATWQASDIRLDTGDTAGANDSFLPSISNDGSGYVYVTWQDYRNGMYDIYFNHSSDDGANWQTNDIRLDVGDTPGASNSNFPRISSDNSGHIYVTWDDDRNGAPDIYFDALSLDPGGKLTQTTNVINTGDDWRYFKGFSNPGAGWDDYPFDDSAWLVGPTGIGFGDRDDATVLKDMKDNYLTVYARKTFNVSNASWVTGMSLRMDYDDGFVAYINGQEVTRASMPAGMPAFDTLAIDHEAKKPEAFDLGAYTGELVTGTNVMAIEIHNKKIGDRDLSMIPELDIDRQ